MALGAQIPSDASLAAGEQIVIERDTTDESRRLQQQWHGWASPVGLGIGLLTVGGFFALLAYGLTLLVSIQ
jgi:hypothetical protein